MKEYIFRDPVHGDITVQDPTVLGLIDAPEFQRLRRIRQLGTSFVSYPGAEHTRFAHSLGVYHLAARVLRHLHDHGQVHLPAEEQVLVCCAALLHDIGHGPFSHLFEKLTGTDHEYWVQRIVLAPETRVHQVLAQRDPDWPGRVAALLGAAGPGAHRPGAGHGPAGAGPPFVRDLLSSQLDVDRMDYLLRDAMMCGVSYGRFDLDRLVACLAVHEGRLVVHGKGQSAAESFLLARYFMYWNVYFHKATRASEAVLGRVLQRAADLHSAGERAALGPFPPALEPVLARRPPALDEYLLLDEVDVLQAVKGWVGAPDPVLADLSARFLHRRLFRGIRLKGPPSEATLARLEQVLAAAGCVPPAYYMEVDRAANVAYAPYTRPGDGAPQPILVLDDQGHPAGVEEIARRSQVLRGVTEEPLTRHVLFVPKEVSGQVLPLLGGQLYLEL